MDGFQGYATATTTMLPAATKVMDPFHVVHLAALKLTASRQRIQQITTGARGKKTDLLYTSRRRLLTRKALLTDTQKNALKALWLADENHSVVAGIFTKASSALTSIPINMLAEN